MITPQRHINARALRAETRRSLRPHAHRAATAALFVLVLAGSLIAADSTLRLARGLPDVLARAAAERGW